MPTFQSGIEIFYTNATLQLRFEDLLKRYASPVDNNLACVFEIYRYPPANIRLHLTKTPLRLIRMPHDHPGFQH